LVLVRRPERHHDGGILQVAAIVSWSTNYTFFRLMIPTGP